MRTLPLVLGLSVFLSGCSLLPGGGEGSSSSRMSLSSSSLPTLDESYTNDAASYSLTYPEGWTVKENDTLVTRDDGELKGTSFYVPESVLQGTKVSEARVHVYVGSVCPDLKKGTPILIGKRFFSRSTWSDVGAGNLYTGEAYTLRMKDTCYTLTYFTHACNLGPECGENITELDQKPLKDAFRAMITSFTLTSSSSSSR